MEIKRFQFLLKPQLGLYSFGFYLVYYYRKQKVLVSELDQDIGYI